MSGVDVPMPDIVRFLDAQNHKSKRTGFFSNPLLEVGLRDPWANLRYILARLRRSWRKSRMHELLPAQWLAARNKPA